MVSRQGALTKTIDSQTKAGEHLGYLFPHWQPMRVIVPPLGILDVD